MNKMAQPKDETAFWDEQKTREQRPGPTIDGPTRRSKIVSWCALAMVIVGAISIWRAFQ